MNGEAGGQVRVVIAPPGGDVPGLVGRRYRLAGDGTWQTCVRGSWFASTYGGRATMEGLGFRFVDVDPFSSVPVSVPDEAWRAADLVTRGLEGRSDILARGVAAAVPVAVAAALRSRAASFRLSARRYSAAGLPGDWAQVCDAFAAELEESAIAVAADATRVPVVPQQVVPQQVGAQD